MSIFLSYLINILTYLNYLFYARLDSWLTSIILPYLKGENLNSVEFWHKYEMEHFLVKDICFLHD